MQSTLDDTLRSEGFTGSVVLLGEPGYDDARQVWNAAVDGRPAAVAYAQDADDVAAAVRAARAHGLVAAPRCGGHSSTGKSVRDGVLCIDMRALNAVSVDPESGLVRAGGGTLLAELDAATQEHGLAVPAGQISHTGVAGLTLGGGLGWLMRHHGLTIDSLLAAEVVMADGTAARVSAEEHPELFWALRGGGGDFAAVTAFEFMGRRVGPMVLAGMFVYPWEQAREAVQAARELTLDGPRELTTFAVMLTAPPAEPFPPELQGRPVVAVSVAWSGADLAAGERAFAGLRSTLPPALDLVGPMPYTALQQMLDPTAPPGGRYRDALHYLDEVSDAFIDTLIERFATTPSPETHLITSWLGGALDDVAPGETAFGHRSARALCWMIGATSGPELDPVVDWIVGTWEATRRFAAGGRYVNATPTPGTAPSEAFAPDVWRRLEDVKRRYDPDGVFDANGLRQRPLDPAVA